MNILLVTGGFAEKNKPLSGMPAYLHKVSKCLQARGHQVVILTADKKTYRWIYDGIEICSVSVSKTDGDNAWVKYGLNAVRREIAMQKEIKKVCIEKSIDLIQYSGWFGVGLFHSGKIPAVMRMSSYAKVQLKLTYDEKEIEVISLLERMAARRMNVVYAPSNAIAIPLEEDINKKVYVIETPFIEGQIDTKLNLSVLNEKLAGKKYLLFFGRMSPDKGILTINRIIHKLLEDNRELYFAFAGPQYVYQDTNTWKMLLKSAGEYSNRIIYLGNLTHDVLMPVLDNAYAVVLPSLMDNLPNACQEAMYRGKVVIGTYGSSLDQLIEDDKSGYLSRPNDGESLYNAIEKALMADGDKRRMMAMKAKKRIELLKPEHTVAKLEKLYGAVMKNDNKTSRH